VVATLGHLAVAGAAPQQPAAAQPRTSEITPGDPLFAETSAIRELAIRRPVKSAFASRDEIERFAIMKFDEQTTADEVRAAELTLRVLGLVPRDFTYRSFFAALMKEQVAGAYDPAAQQLQLPDWVPIGAQSAVLVHELTHALQDQHFDLGRLERWQPGDSDAQLAAHALAEGDAMLTMIGYLTRHPDAAATLLQSAAAMADTPVLNSAPAALRETLGFPYEYGMQFASALHATDGWKAVSTAYNKLPLSTEQVMHPPKYLAYESPTAVQLPELAQVLGSGWRRLESDVHGEWGYLQILKAYLPPGDRAAKAAEGWGGDRYAIYAGPRPDDAALIQVSAWDTVADAAEFFDAYGDRTRTRDGLSRVQGNAPPRAADNGRSLLTGGAGTVLIEFRGTRTVIIEGSSGVDVAALAAAVWR
jgi:hypothetical protein